jgi:hypothetical protein
MAGETNLDRLLAGLAPKLHSDEFVFCTAAEPAGTLILRRGEAERLGLPFTYPCRMITLTVHSSLEAVGLLARVSALLAERGISVNAVSAYYHDHLFVPVERAEEALEALRTARRSPR